MSEIAFDYLKRKKAGTVCILRMGATHTVVLRQFDPETGQEIEPRMLPVDAAQLQVQRKHYQDMLEILDELLVDLASAQEVATPVAQNDAQGASDP